MRALRILLSVLVCAGTVTGAAAQLPDAVLEPLQGRWVVTGGEHNAKPLDVVKGGVMTVTGNAFEVRTASGNILKGTLRLDASKQPAHIDFLHADGERWEGIYDVSGEGFRLNYVEAGGKDPRPTAFATSDKTEETVITMRREGK